MKAANGVDSSAWLEYFADSLIYATARRHGATLWTQDERFKDLPHVRFFPRGPAV